MISRIGKYTVEKELGQGGFGIVYLALDPDTGQPVAIKRLRAEGDPDLLKRFQSEIRTTASLRHKNIVIIHASGEEAGDPYLVMEFLEGQTLKQVIDGRRPLSLLDKVRIMTQVAEGLAYAHSRGVVHRDVKPENIMLLPDDNVKIMDFGIALGPERTTKVTQTGGIIGTPPYFAPEQLEGYKANEQTDIFSYGDVYYELLSGSHPFEKYRKEWKSLQLAILTYEPQAISELVPGCPESLETLVHRTLAKQPEFRYQKFSEIQEDSEAILVDLKHEGAAAILREIPSLMQAGNVETALSRIRQAYQLEPGNREVRRWREEINLRLQEAQKQKRVAELQAEAERNIDQKRYAEAVQNLELAIKFDSSNVLVADRLREARLRLDNYVRVNRLVSEARFQEQKGLFGEAQDRLREALTIDPDHTDAKRLSDRVEKELDRRRLEQLRQRAIRTARDHLEAKRFVEALATLDDIDKDFPGAEGVTELRRAIQEKQEQEAGRIRAERFNLALDRTREALQSGDIERARPMIDHVAEAFSSEGGAGEILRELRERLATLVQAKEIAQYQQSARSLLRQKAFGKALELLAEACGKFPDDAGLGRLNHSAQELYQAHQRSESIAAVVKEAAAKRDSGDLDSALDAITDGRRLLGDDSAFTELERQIEIEIEQQRHSEALNKVLSDARGLMAAGRYSEAVELLSGPAGLASEAEVRALLDSARAAAAIQEERRLVEQILASSAKLQAEANWNQALTGVEEGLARYPHNSSLRQAAGRLREKLEAEQRRSLIEQHRAAVLAEINSAQWKQAEASLRKARAEFPDETAFDELSERVQNGLYEEGWRELAERVNQNLADRNLSQAQGNLEEEETRTMYALDPRWQALAGKVAGAIQQHRSETLRQAEIARKAEEIRECLKRNQLDQAALDLAAARTRYPGENEWSELQAELDTQKEAARRQNDLAAAEAGIEQALSRDDVRLAWSGLFAARQRFPSEMVWTGLETRIRAREEELQHEQEIARSAERIRFLLSRDHVAAGGEAAFPQNTKIVLRRRGEDLRAAMAEWEAARGRYPAEPIWGALQKECDARRAFLGAEGEIAERLGWEIETGDLATAEALLRRARADYPDESFWALLAGALDRRRELLRLQSEIARLVDTIRDHLQREGVAAARRFFEEARRSYPGQEAWTVLQGEIEAAEARAAHQLELETIEHQVDALVRAESWRGRRIEDQWEAFQQAAAVLSVARAKYPHEERLAGLQPVIESQRAGWQQQVVETITAMLRSAPARGFSRQPPVASVSVLCQRDPGNSVWRRLRSEIEAAEARLARQAEVAEMSAHVRESLDRDEIRQAEAELSAGRAKYPDEDVWENLQAQVLQWRQQQRSSARDRLLAIETQIVGETGKRKRKDLDRQARIIAERYPDDPEITALVHRIHAVAVAETAAATPRKPWKWIAAGATVITAAALVVGFYPKQKPIPPPPPAVTPVMLEIRTDPPGASVRMADRSCVTPNCRFDLPPGDYPLEARLPGYEPQQKTVRVDSSHRLIDLNLTPLPVASLPTVVPATLVIRTGVADALVFVDNVPQRDRTNQSGSVTLSLEAKPHEIRVERTGYEKTAARRVVIHAGEQQTLAFAMHPENARLELTAVDPNVEVFVDGKSLGRTDASRNFRFPGPVAPGEHRLEVSRGQFEESQTAQLTQRFEPGQTVILAWKGPPPLPPPPVTVTPPAPPVNPSVGTSKAPTPEEIQEELDWKKTSDGLDLARLREFRRKYPNSSHAKAADAAIDRLDDRAWARITKDDPSSLRGYLTDFPKGSHASEAASRLDELLWKSVDQNNIEQVRQFVETNPTSTHFREAQRILDRFNDRQEVYRKQVRETIQRLDQAIARKPVKESDLKGIWTGNDASKRRLLDSLKIPGQQITFTVQEPPNIQSDTTATVRCTMSIGLDKIFENVVVALRETGGAWMIEAVRNPQ
jgi:hypothetical protein